MATDTTNTAAALLPSVGADQWLVERTRQAALQLDECVKSNRQKLGGVPVLKGTRISVAQILAEIGEGQSIQAVADDFDLDPEMVKKLVTGLAICLDRAAAK